MMTKKCFDRLVVGSVIRTLSETAAALCIHNKAGRVMGTIKWREDVGFYLACENTEGLVVFVTNIGNDPMQPVRSMRIVKRTAAAAWAVATG